MTGYWFGHTGIHAEGRMYCGEYAAWCYVAFFPYYWKTAPSVISESTGFDIVYKGIMNL